MKKKNFFLLGAIIPLLSGCVFSNQSANESDGKSANGESVGLSSGDLEPDSSENGNSGYEQSGAITISLVDGASITSNSTNVTIDNQTNIITIKAVGVYVLSGKLTNGQILIDAYRTASVDTVELQLNGVNISCSFGAPIFSKQNSGTYKDPKLKIKKVELSTSVINDNRSSSLVSSWTREDTAAIFANSDLSIVGTGKLTINSSFNNGAGTDDELKIKNGELTIMTMNNGLKAHDGIYFGTSGGADAPSVGITSLNGNAIRQDTAATGDGIYVYSGSIIAVSKYDGFDAEQDVVINGGTIQLIAGGGSTVKTDTNKTTIPESMKGIKALGNITISNATITISSHDDAIHSGASIAIASGTLSLMSDDDGIHAENTFTLTDGSITITQSYEGIEAPTININGGNSNIRSRDDGWNAAMNSTGIINLSGGYHYLNTVGDGIDSNGNIIITGGTVVCEGPTANNNGPLDCGDNGNYIQQDGGMIFAIGSSGMAVGATRGTQYSILTKGTNCNLGDYYIIESNDGTPLFSVKTTQACQSVYFSAPNMVAGTYKLVKGQIANGVEVMTQLYSGGTASSVTSLCSWTWSTSNVHATYGSSSGPGGH